MTLTLKKRYSSRESPEEGLVAMTVILVVTYLTHRDEETHNILEHSHSKREKIYMYIIIMLSPKTVE